MTCFSDKSSRNNQMIRSLCMNQIAVCSLLHNLLVISCTEWPMLLASITSTTSLILLKSMFFVHCSYFSVMILMWWTFLVSNKLPAVNNNHFQETRSGSRVHKPLWPELWNSEGFNLYDNGVIMRPFPFILLHNSFLQSTVPLLEIINVWFTGWERLCVINQKQPVLGWV